MELNGRVAFGRMDAVTFGRPANEALLEEIKNYDANRVFLLASGTLNRNTDEIDKIRRSLGNKCVGEFFICLRIHRGRTSSRQQNWQWKKKQT